VSRGSVSGCSLPCAAKHQRVRLSRLKEMTIGMHYSQPSCRPTRRQFLWESGGGFVGTALTYLLANDGFLPRSVSNQIPNSLAPRQPHFAARAKSCIFLFMYGGVSQVDTWDP